MDYLLIAVLAAWPIWILIIRPWRVMAFNPPSDVLRIKRDFEGQGRTVTAVRRDGTDWGGRSQPTFRRYVVTVRRHDGEAAEFPVGVAFGFTSDAELKEYEPKRRRAFFQGSQSHF